MAGVMVGGPTPWWQLPNYRGSRENLETSAPSGYEYDPVKMAYVRTPTSAGQRVNQYTSAAMGGSLDGLRTAAGVFGVGGGGGTAGATSTGMGGGVLPSGAGIAPGTRIPGIAPIDTTASNAAIFGRAKDMAGQIGRSSLDALRAALGETGQLGGGAEVQGARDIIENAAGQVGNVNRELAIQNATQGLDVAKANQAAGITQRGQDIAAQEAQARLAQEYTQMQFQQAALQSQRQIDLLRLALSQASQAPAGLY